MLWNTEQVEVNFKITMCSIFNMQDDQLCLAQNDTHTSGEH